MSDVCLAYFGDRKLERLSLRRDFGAVVCGKEVTETFEIENDKNIPLRYSVVDEDPEPDSFTIHPKRLQVPPGKKARFKVTFKSHVPEIVYEKKYSISDGRQIVAELSTRCTSLGPSIRPRQVTLTFFILRNAKIQSKRCELENTSLCPARFHFERPGNNRPFRIKQESGEIHGGGKFIFDIKFEPKQLGLYCKRVYCLFQYHPPILFTLIGLYKPGLRIEPNKLRFCQFPEEDTNDNYEAFMRNLNESHVTDDADLCLELVSARKAVVQFDEDEKDENDSSNADTEESGKENADERDIYKAVLSRYYLNMGNNSVLTDGIRLMNTSATREFYFEWSIENGKYFSVCPRSGNLKEGQRIDLEVKFVPDLPDRLFSGELDLRIFPISNEGGPSDVVTLPTTINLSLIGHSFPDSSAGWLKQCAIEPDHLMLPACICEEVVYSTLLLKRFGHLPVTYQFIPPKRSRIKIKPPMGYVSDSVQLFVVQFVAPTGWDGNYTESWKVAYNSTEKSHDVITITSKVENPKLSFGGDNVVEFDTTLPGGVSKSSVPIANSTGLKIQYEFVIPSYITWIEVPVLTGELEPLSSAYMEIVFKPTEMREYSDCVYCWTRSATRQDCSVSNRIELKGSCQDGFVVAIPASHNFGRCVLGTELNKTFNVFNFTPVLMHYKLLVISDAFPVDSMKNVVEVYPSRGSISGKSNIEVEVSVTPKIAEPCKICIQCQLLSSDAEDAPPCGNPRTLFTLNLDGILPTYQIIDLHVDGGGPLISPDWLWKMMNIKGINKALRTVLPGETASMHVKLPDAAIGSSTMTIYMLIEAGGDYGLSAQFKNIYRKHFARKLTLTLLQADGHNNMTVLPSVIHLQPRCREVVKMELKYDAVGSTFHEWSLNLSLNRVITITSVVNGLPNDEPSQVSMLLEPEIELKPVFIGDLNPPVQLFWLYNNTPIEASYILDKTFLRDATLPFPRIFDCLNANGILPPYSCVPLMLKFEPNELREYEARTHLCLKADCMEALTIIGSGVLNFSNFSEFSHERTIPPVSLFKQTRIAVEPSVKVFTVKPFPTFTSVQRIFFLENVSEDKVWAFQWHSFNIENLIQATVEPKEGQINPGERIIMKLTITSYSRPATVSFSIPCDVIDYTSLESYENAVYVKETIAEKCKDHFTITEKGITNEIPEVPLPEKPIKSHVFVTVRTNVVVDQSIEAKLYPKDVQRLPCGTDLRDFRFERTEISEDIVRLVNRVVEQAIWNLLHSPNFLRKLSDYNEECGNATYREILPSSEKEMKKLQKSSFSSIPKNLVQNILENTFIDVLNEKFSHS